MPIKITKLNLFPFKSLKGISLDEVEVDEHGFKYDRIFMLLHRKPQGHWDMVTQREEPTIARIEEAIVEPNLELSYAGGPTLRIPLDFTASPAVGPNLSTVMWGEEVVCKNVSTPEQLKFFVDFLNTQGTGGGSAASGGSPKYTHENIAIVAPYSRRKIPEDMDHTKTYLAKAEEKITANFQDVWPLTIMATASYEDLKRHVEITEGTPALSEISFRMNIEVETEEPWEEDDWRLVRIAGREFVVDSPLERCPMPAIDQDTGTFREKRNPLPALNRFRVLEKGKTPCFGVNVLNKDSGYKLRVGDTLEVLEKEDW